MEFFLLLLLPAFALLAADFGMAPSDMAEGEAEDDDPLETYEFEPLSEDQITGAHQEVMDLFPDLIPADGTEDAPNFFSEIWSDPTAQLATGAAAIGLGWGDRYSVRSFKGRFGQTGFDTLTHKDSAELLFLPDNDLSPIPVADFRLGKEILLIEASEDMGVISILPMSNGDALVLLGDTQVLRVLDAADHLIADDIRRITSRTA